MNYKAALLKLKPTGAVVPVVPVPVVPVPAPDRKYRFPSYFTEGPDSYRVLSEDEAAMLENCSPKRRARFIAMLKNGTLQIGS